MITATTSYTSYARDMTSSLQRIANQKTVQAATKAFERDISKVEDIDDFMSNKSVYIYALKAYGLEDNIGSKGLIRKVLSGGNGSGSLASKLTDAGFKKLATAFTFDSDGKATFNSSVAAAVESAYYRQTLENNAGQENSGSQLALYFQRAAASVTSVWGILGDKDMLQVVKVALGLPDAMANMSLDAQAALIKSKLNIDDFKDPTKVDKLVAKFTARYDAQKVMASAANPVADLLASLRATGTTPSGSTAGASILSILSSR